MVRLVGLARLLSFVPDVRLDISGYTDNIGTSTANNIFIGQTSNATGTLVAIGSSSQQVLLADIEGTFIEGVIKQEDQLIIILDVNAVLEKIIQICDSTEE